MITFLKTWHYGVNAIALIINSQCNDFDTVIHKLIKLMKPLFNDPTFWNHICLVFTNCYAGCDSINKPLHEHRYRTLLLDWIQQCQTQNSDNPPPLPVFFVDSMNWNTDPETRDQYRLLHGFVCGFKPLQTFQNDGVNNFVKIEQETRNSVLVNTRIEGDIRIETYEDQKREKRIQDDGKTVTYSEWMTIRTWENRKDCTQQKSTKIIFVKERRRQMFPKHRYLTK